MSVRTLGLVGAGLCISLIFAGPGLADDGYVGAEVCGSCHAAEYKQWKQTGHAMALARLSSTQQKDATCRSCHTMDSARSDLHLRGVQCESCHGAGKYYRYDYVMKDSALRKLFGLETISEATCARCHRSDGPGLRTFDFKKNLEPVLHRKRKAAHASHQAPSRASVRP